jgi:hypothetical protein
LDIRERIIKLIEAEKSDAEFCRKAKWTSGDISHLRNKLDKRFQHDKLQGILDGYPSVSAEWLMRGEGDMQRIGDGNNINVQLANGHGNTQQYTVSDVAHLQALLAEKERTIQILMEKK